MTQAIKAKVLNGAFENMPSTSRVWIYQADRKLNAEEQSLLHELVKPFVDNWSAHGTNLKSEYTFLYDTFLVLMVDEEVEPASGCSIDESVHLVQNLEKEIDASFMDRMMVTYREGDEIQHVPMSDFWALIKSGRVTQETIVYNNLVKNKAELESNWEVPLKESWHKQMFD